MRMIVSMLLMCAATAAVAQGSPGVRYVFFDWGKGELTGDAKAELDKVAADYSSNPRPLILGAHSDRSGPSGANLASSKRRGLTVRDYLVGKGVPGSAITVSAYGEAQPIISTGDGVREVQNRRVEVRFGR